jgi:hypothetical protein
MKIFLDDELRTLEMYKQAVSTLAIIKDFNMRPDYLLFRTFNELGELTQKFMHRKNHISIGKEFADIMHFLLQFMYSYCPEINCDKILEQVIKNNYKTKKKTIVKGRIVKR